jgi:hypothetical protein
MGIESGFGETSGYLRIGKITSVRPDVFRCDLSFPGTYSSAKDVSIIPNPLFGFMPTVGTYVGVYDRPGVGKRVLCLLDAADGRSPDEILEQETKSGTIPTMEPGDVYIGHRGRAYFNKHGDVHISARGSRAYLDLKCEKAKAELYAYNFDIFTPGNNVRIHSSSTVPLGPLQTWGDSLSIEVNTPLASAGIDDAPEVLPTNLGRLKISNVGSIDLDVLPMSAAVNLHMDITGQIGLGRGLGVKTIGLDISPVGTDIVKLYTLGSNLILNNSSQTVTLSNLIPKTSLLMDGTGNVTLGAIESYFKRDFAGKTVTMVTSGGSITLKDTGEIIQTGKTVDINGTAGVTLIGPDIKLGQTPAGHVAFAEILYNILNQLYALNMKIMVHTHPVVGVVPAGTPLAAPSPILIGAVPPVPPLSTIGSTTVSAQA